MTQPAPGDEELFRRILVVDDDPDIVTTVRTTLELEGFEVITAGSAEQAERAIARHGLPHLAVIDIMMPGVDGVELARSIQAYADLPVILLTAVDDDETRVRAIEEVAEDYLTKPFHPPELAARVRRVLRRIGDFSFRLEPRVEVDDRLSLDVAGRTAFADGDEVSLTPTEAKILHILLTHAPRPARVDYLLGRLWPLEEVYDDTLRVHVHRLRQKIEPDASEPRYVVTVRGVGYRFDMP